jgi:hypothetical protein
MNGILLVPSFPAGTIVWRLEESAIGLDQRMAYDLFAGNDMLEQLLEARTTPVAPITRRQRL